MRNRKFQVFVSSTYVDLKKERQAAVEAILSAGHIPAGMELFTAGDQSQWDVIKEWIEESDVYLLILGGRYGSIEQESGMSYTHLEFNYAISLGKPFFSVVITDRMLNEKVSQEGKEVLELDKPAEFKEFKKLVRSKMVKFWDDQKDIKLAIHETLNLFSKRPEIVGWIPGDQGVNGAELSEEMARLSKENSNLRERLSSLTENENVKISGVEIDEFVKILKIEFYKTREIYNEILRQGSQKLATKFSEKFMQFAEIDLFAFFEYFEDEFDGINMWPQLTPVRKLSNLGLINLLQAPGSGARNVPILSNDGRTLLLYFKQPKRFTLLDEIQSQQTFNITVQGDD